MFKFVSESILGFAVPLLQNSGIISMDLASSYNSISLLLFVAALFILFLVAFAKTERKIKMICIPAFVIPLAVSSVVNGLSNMLFKEIYYASIVSPSPETLIASSAVSVVSAIIIIGISFALTYVYLSKAEEYFIPATEIDINNTSAQPQRTPVPVSPGIQGAPQMTCNGNYSQSPPKSKIVAALLCFFLGAFGIHRFYVGKVGTGILWLFTGGLFFIGDFVDFFVIIFGGFKDSEGKKLE